MQRPEPRLTPMAWDDLDHVFDAVLESSGSAGVAASAYEGILASIEAAASLPLAAPSVQARTGIVCDYRWTEHKGWLAFFHVLPNGGVLVDRVLWGKSEWQRALGLGR